MRVGIGYDVHKLVENRPLILGGVTVKFYKGLLGHSDADVLLHAIIDAILGAARLGDIGKMFPDSDDQFKNISSVELLKRANHKICTKGLIVSNIDATIVCQSPKLSPYIEQMISNIANALAIEKSRVNVKATTTEGLGFEGEGLGISAQAVCLLGPED